ncbi:prolyl-tRNA synthetase [Myriangium duriaei CBS 260.36]|uniref:proline--tRNA ligase n=1 Tax=Myriangium duriaei CBS 260.36 TaxID=1168546 RepID=A0A9P4J1F0_9PEZI|nr:prolyl-tRNA synthetase [Myriangium duriaei CBS 260.36]
MAFGAFSFSTRGLTLTWVLLAPLLARHSSSNSHESIHRLSNFWTPTENQIKGADKSEDVHTTLVRAGFLRQTHSGIFHLLPLGFRVQQKLESLIDDHMEQIGASKVSMSTISSEKLWKASGRLTGKDSELFRFKDRKDAKLLLSPTHEEEITSLVANSVHSYRDLPLRLYQVTRKYRDEARPRQGLLRGREFLMKDLYTFDSTVEDAIKTYDRVRAAYHSFFTDLRIPFLTAAADSGSMGGSLSHEYHLPSPTGEDHIITCDGCGKTMNEEVAIIDMPSSAVHIPVNEVETDIYTCVTKDRKTLIRVLYPRYTLDGTAARLNTLNTYAVRAALPDLDLDLSSADPDSLHQGTAQILLHDARLVVPALPSSPFVPVRATIDSHPIYLTALQPGDICPTCLSGKLSIVPAIEVGHTFHLGDRYSAPLQLRVKSAADELVNVQMGCHGIGVSRLVAAIAAVKADEKGLQWPARVAPFSVVVIPGKGNEGAAEEVARVIQGYLRREGRGGDVVIDDREKPVGWKFKDADLIGYPVVVVVGRTYTADGGEVEVQCRQLGVKETLPSDTIPRSPAHSRRLSHSGPSSSPHRTRFLKPQACATRSTAARSSSLTQRSHKGNPLAHVTRTIWSLDVVTAM